MWIRRLSITLILLAFIALGVYVYFFYSPPPDRRMACYYGAYETGQGRSELIVVTPTTGSQALRMVMMSGETWRLERLASDTKTVPTQFAP